MFWKTLLVFFATEVGKTLVSYPASGKCLMASFSNDLWLVSTKTTCFDLKFPTMWMQDNNKHRLQVSSETWRWWDLARSETGQHKSSAHRQLTFQSVLKGVFHDVKGCLASKGKLLTNKEQPQRVQTKKERHPVLLFSQRSSVTLWYFCVLECLLCQPHSYDQSLRSFKLGKNWQF